MGVNMEKQTIWLAFEDNDQCEHHMRWVGHDTLETANAEFDYIKKAVSSGDGKMPNTYIYSADVPKYGYPEEEFDLGEFENVFTELNKSK